ncbi:21171_t:CDS:2, partial [Entrophospora sp. SA101]
PSQTGVFKTNTVLSYDDSLKLLAWGYPALAEEPSKRSKRNQTQSRPVELFKLHLANVKEDEKPPLPLGLDSRRAITDYLHEMNKVTEAAAIYCIKTLAEHNLAVGLDCGGGTVDLTTRTLLPQNKLGEITERSGDLCGSSYVDREFLKYLGKKLGFAAMKKLKENNYGQLQYLVQYFCNRVKFTFSGNPNGFTTKEIDIEKVCPALMKYVTGNARDQMEEAEWLIELEFQVIKDMFDPVVNKIIELIRRQLGQMERRCMAMFLVTIIAVPKHPIAAVVRGSLEYGLNMGVVQTRVLKFCYGVEVSAKWEKNDPPERKTPTGRIFRFHKLAFRGTEVSVDQKFSYTAAPVATNQIDMTFNIFITTDNNARYCDEDGMRMLGKMKIDLPDPQKGKNRLVEFSLTFGTMEVKAMAINKRTGQIYESNFVLEF